MQQEDLIAQIHNEELPPDSYYSELEEVLAALFPKSTKDARHHIVALSAAFDTAAAFALSFGVKKFMRARESGRGDWHDGFIPCEFGWIRRDDSSDSQAFIVFIERRIEHGRERYDHEN